MRNITTAFSILLLSVVLAATGSGCLSGDGGSDGDRPSPSRPGDDAASNDRVPKSADLVQEGREQMRWRADRAGRVYLYEADDRRVLGNYPISSGQEFIVSPKDARAWIDETRVLDYSFDREHTHRIYFLSDRRTDREPPREPDQPAGPIFGGGAGATVPKSATIPIEGRGEDLSFEADGVGTVYIYDVDAKNTIATYNLKKGQRFTVSPGSGEASVDGRVVIRKSMNVRKTYRLYFNLNA